MIIVIATVVRFVGLEKSPPGFFYDESVMALNVITLSDTGSDISGRPMPLFPVSGGGGVNTPTHVYPAILWSRIFGRSIGAFRAMAAFETTVSMVGIYFLSRLMTDQAGALLVTLCAGVSPWAFQWARQACDDPTLYPCGMIWGSYFFLRGRGWVNAMAAAGAFSAAVYAYPPARLHVPVLALLLIWFGGGRESVSPRSLAVFFVTGLVLCLPLVYFLIRGDLMARYYATGVFAPVGGAAPSLIEGLMAVGRNFCAFFTARFLFISGDANLRHSTQFCGELSWLESLAVLVGLPAVVIAHYTHRKVSLGADRFAAGKTLVFCLAAGVTAFLPAAMTVDGGGHSLRAVGAWPFVSLFCGLTLRLAASRWSAVYPAAGIVAAIFLGCFMNYYFRVYPKLAADAFQEPIKQGAMAAEASGNWADFIGYMRVVSPEQGRYYLVVYGHFSVKRSEELLPLF